MKVKVMISFVILFGMAVTAVRAQGESVWQYGVFELSSYEDSAKSGQREFHIEMDLGKKSRDKKLAKELREALVGQRGEGVIEIKAVKDSGIIVAYPESIDDCSVLADATRAARVAIKYMPKGLELKFNWAMTRGKAYQVLPPCGEPTIAVRPPVLRFSLWA